ncbi:MAG: DUF1801 domain-containing protein [Leptospira sp.]|nr:DUF1801 domain-containing protein [Leptospira sp.]
MSKKQKTTETNKNVAEFIESYVDKESKKKASFRLMELMKEWSGCNPRIWGESIIGFGSYHYKYESGHEGDAPLIGFSPRKGAISLYVYAQGSDNDSLLEKLGKYKMGVACIYINKLDDIDLSILKKICKTSINFLKKKYS